MNQATVTETQFESFHEELKQKGYRIIRCVERSVKGKEKTFTFVWV